jgi:hypothetical protein
MANENQTIPPQPSRGDFPAGKRGGDQFQDALKSWNETWGALAKARASGAAGDVAETERKRQERQKYQGSIEGTVLGYGRGFPALALGAYAGAKEAKALGNVMYSGMNKLGIAVNPYTRAVMFAPFGLASGLGLYKAHEFDQQANDPESTYAQRDRDRFTSNAALGWGTANAYFGGAEALRGVAAPRPDAQTAASPDAPPPTNNQPPAAPYKGSRVDVSGELVRDFGGKPGKTKGPNLQAALTAIDSADEATLRNVAARAKESGFAIDPKASVGDVRAALKGFAGSIKGAGGPLAILAALGLGAALDSDEAQAGSVTGMRETGPSLNPRPSRGQQITNALGKAAGAIPEAALYAVPGVGQGLMARDVANAAESAYTPSPEYLAEARAGKPGRIGREVERAQMQDNLAAAQAEDRRQVNALGQSQGYDWQRPREPLDMSRVPQSMRRFVDPLSSAASDPAFEAALAELIAAHGGR